LVPALSDPLFAQFLATAHSLADRAAEVILPHFRAIGAIDHKGGDWLDPVTAADVGAERAIRAALAEFYPDHGVVGEELGRKEGAGVGPYCWVIDPIDGTRAFIIGQPLWGSLIGLARNGEPLLGLMAQPFTKERFWSGERESWYRHDGLDRPIKTRSCPSLKNAFMASSAPEMFDPDEAARFEILDRKVRMRRFGGDCYNYCLLAMGQLDLVVEAGLNAYDILALIPIIDRAGGIVTTWDGGDAKDGGRILAAGDPKLHAAAMKVLAS
jgi:histidinol phosphatase-like enzyme (inositol monophosphatase family)